MSAAPTVAIRSLTFSDGTELTVEVGDIVVFVGPNNAGKSKALSDVRLLIGDRRQQGVVIKGVEIERSVEIDDMVSWLEANFSRSDSSDPSDPSFQGRGISLTVQQAKAWWRSIEGLHNFAAAFVSHLTTEARLKASDPAPSINFLSNAPSHPIHRLYVDESIEEKISSYFKQAFKEDLIVNRAAGTIIPFHCGDRSDLGHQRQAIQFLRCFANMPQLHLQGDGMRSFVGVLLNTLVYGVPAPKLPQFTLRIV